MNLFQDNMAKFDKRWRVESEKWQKKWTLTLTCFIIGHTGFMDPFLVYYLSALNMRQELHRMPMIGCVTHSKGLHVTRVVGGMGAAPMGN